MNAVVTRAEPTPPENDLMVRVAELEKSNKGLTQAAQAEREKRHQLEVSLADARGRLEANAEGNRGHKIYSRAQLNELVTEGRLSQEQADLTWDNQLDHRIEQRVHEGLSATEQKAWVQAEIERYKEVKPELMVPGSEERAAIEEEIRYQQRLAGGEVTIATELAALRARYGPPERLVRAKTLTDTHPESSSGAPPEDADSATRADGSPKGLTARERAYYGSRVGPGKLYKDWKAVEEELKFANPALRKKRA